MIKKKSRKAFVHVKYPKSQFLADLWTLLEWAGQHWRCSWSAACHVHSRSSRGISALLDFCIFKNTCCKDGPTLLNCIVIYMEDELMLRSVTITTPNLWGLCALFFVLALDLLFVSLASWSLLNETVWKSNFVCALKKKNYAGWRGILLVFYLKFSLAWFLAGFWQFTVRCSQPAFFRLKQSVTLG